MNRTIWELGSEANFGTGLALVEMHHSVRGVTADSFLVILLSNVVQYRTFRGAGAHDPLVTLLALKPLHLTIIGVVLTYNPLGTALAL